MLLFIGLILIIHHLHCFLRMVVCHYPQPQLIPLWYPHLFMPLLSGPSSFPFQFYWAPINPHLTPLIDARSWYATNSTLIIIIPINSSVYLKIFSPRDANYILLSFSTTFSFLIRSSVSVHESAPYIITGNIRVINLFFEFIPRHIKKSFLFKSKFVLKIKSFEISFFFFLSHLISCPEVDYIIYFFWCITSDEDISALK